METWNQLADMRSRKQATRETDSQLRASGTEKLTVEAITTVVHRSQDTAQLLQVVKLLPSVWHLPGAWLHFSSDVLGTARLLSSWLSLVKSCEVDS